MATHDGASYPDNVYRAHIRFDLADVKEGESSGVRTVVTTTFVSYEGKPSFASDTFKFSIPPGSVEAKPPI